MARKAMSAVVLMADDDPDDCLFVGDAFTETRMAGDFRCVENGLELLQYLRREGKYIDSSVSPCPDLILLDLNMPIKDGRQALKEIKAHPALRVIPVVVLSTSEEERDIEKSYELGACSYITKPADFNDLISLVRTLGEYWFELVRLPQQWKEY